LYNYEKERHNKRKIKCNYKQKNSQKIQRVLQRKLHKQISIIREVNNKFLKRKGKMGEKQKDLDGKEIPLKEGYIPDLATGKPVDIRKPEETVRQEFERILHENYGYDYEQMDIEVKIQRGEIKSKKNQKERADIVVYKTTDKTKRDQNRDILGIVETKAPNKKEGLKQLMSYMSATSCLWGVWTNGKEIEYVYRDVETGELKTNFIFQIPGKGETWEDIDRITRDKLKPAKSLKPTFRRIYYTLYSNTNISRKEKLGSEMIRLIFCKIYDEKFSTRLRFRIGFKDKPEDVKANIEELWEEVKDYLKEDGIFEKHEKIVLDPKSIMYVVGELERYSLTKTDKDVVGDAFEVFAERQFVGEKGEFFTPREVVKMAVEMINPQPRERILDPACGSGGFLIYALEHVWKEMEKNLKYKNNPELNNLKGEFARKYFYGIDKEIDLVKICKAYMSIIGDGRSNIVKADSLKSPEEWEPITRAVLTEDGKKMKKFDVILTNPPFGSKIKVKHEHILKRFDLGHKWEFKDGKWIKTNKVKETEPQILFIELCLNLLKDGGRMAIVLPDGIFGNPTDGYIREWIKDKAEIMAVVDCPHTTFMPHTHTKTSVLFLRKWSKNKSKNYPIFMSVIEKCGHDNRGKEIFKKDKDGKEVLDEEFSIVANIYKKNPSRVIKGFNRLGFTIYEGNLRKGILIPRYYDPETIKKIEKLEKTGKYELKSIQELIDEGILEIKGAGATVSSYEYNIYDKIPFLRTSDIGSWETRNYAVQNVNEETYIKYKDKQDLREGDILFVKDGTYRIGETIILTKYDLKMLVQSHFLKIRSLDWDKLNPYLLLYLLNAPIVRRQIDERTFVQATLSTIGDRLNEIKLPIPKNKRIREKIANEVKQRIEKRAKLKQEIREIFNTEITEV